MTGTVLSCLALDSVGCGVFFTLMLRRGQARDAAERDGIVLIVGGLLVAGAGFLLWSKGVA